MANGKKTPKDTVAVTYSGPTDQVAPALTAHLANDAELAIATAGDDREAVAAAEAQLERARTLEPGETYDVPAELAAELIRSSQFWSSKEAGAYEALTVTQLDELAVSRAVDNYPSDAKKEDKIAALAK